MSTKKRTKENVLLLKSLVLEGGNAIVHPISHKKVNIECAKINNMAEYTCLYL